MAVFAHSVDGKPLETWEPLGTHLRAVAKRASGFAGAFGWGEAARAIGILHDIGKCSAAFQLYLRQNDRAVRGPDHSTAGAREAASAYPGPLGWMLAAAIAGHHAGLSDAIDLEPRLSAKALEAYEGWRTHAGALPAAGALAGPMRADAELGFSAAFLTRMLFSCLVDADSLETEAFLTAAGGQPVTRGEFSSIAELRDRLRADMARRMASAAPTAVNQLRAEVLDHAVGRASLPPGLFTLTVPTGGGKTLASLSFALDHAVAHGLRRVIVVIPFTSIIEQTAQVYRDALGTDTDVLEHHASVDWERSGATDDEGRDGGQKLRRASENWDAPIVVTTAVQFFESLFANRRSRCRKLHNIAGSVIVLDEAQTSPVHLLAPTLAALRELAANYGATVVVCTATQPAWRLIDGALPVRNKMPPLGLNIGPDRELAPDPVRLYERLKRVTVAVRLDPMGDDMLAARFAERLQMLCIVNSRAHARDLFEAIASLPGAIHLTTLMCPRHRQAVLAGARSDLAASRPVRLVATSLIEAGVDIDFPEVWRAVAGLDQIAQAAGRCNREGSGNLGRVVVFTPSSHEPPPALKAFWQAARPALRAYPDDALSLSAIGLYFRELYFQRGVEALDAGTYESKRWPILPPLAERACTAAFPFATVAAVYRLIDDAMSPVVVPFNEDANAALAVVAATDRPTTAQLRALQPYTVGIPRKARLDWLGAGVLRRVNTALGEALLRFDDLSHYQADTGVDLADPTYRDAERNVI